MKTESLNELREAVDRLTYTASDLSNAKEDILNAIDRIKAAIFMETPAQAGKFNLWDFCSNEEKTRPIMCGIFHDGGYKVACDTRILAACRESYETEKEGATIGKDGRSIAGKYPNWRAVVPTKEESERHEIDTAKVYDAAKREKAENKLAGKYGVKTVAIVRIGDAFFKAESLVKICKFMDHYGVKFIRTYGPRRAAKVSCEDGSVAIIMPIINTTVPVNEAPGYTGSVEANLSAVWEDEKYKFIRLAF